MAQACAGFLAIRACSVVGLLLILGYLVAVIGYPQGEAVALKDQSEPFRVRLVRAAVGRPSSAARVAAAIRSKRRSSGRSSAASIQTALRSSLRKSRLSASSRWPS